MKKIYSLLAFICLTLSALAQVPAYRSGNKIGGPGSEFIEITRLDASGNFYAAGRFDATCNFNPTGVTTLTSIGSSDGFIAKYDPAGALLWVKKIGGGNADRITGMDIDAKGDVYMTGYYSATIDLDPSNATYNITGAGLNDIFVVKFSTNGDFLWGFGLGEVRNDQTEALVLDANGDVYIAGEYNSDSLDLDPGIGFATQQNAIGTFSTYNPFLAKYDSTGNFIWARSFESASSCYMRTMTVDANNRVLVGGYINANMVIDTAATGSVYSIGGSDAFLARFSSAGAFDRCFAIGGTNTDVMYGIATYNDKVYCTGSYAATVDFDPGAGTQNMIAIGNGFNADVFTLALDDTLGYLWSTSVGGAGAETSTNIAINKLGEIFIEGSFVDSADFDPSPDTVMVESVNLRDAFVAKYTNTGDYIWAMNLGSGANADIAKGIVFDTTNQEFIVSGYYSTSALQVDPNDPIVTLSNSGANDSYFVRYGECEFPIINMITTNPGACIGGNSSVEAVVTTPGNIPATITLQWQESTNGGVSWTDMVNDAVYSGVNTAVLGLTAVPQSYNNRFIRLVATSSCGLSTITPLMIMSVVNVDTAVIITNAYTLTAKATGASYQWLDCNNGYSAINGATSRNFIAFAVGSYALKITSGGCTDTSSCYTVTTTGIDQQSPAFGVAVYPSPTSDFINIKTNETNTCELSIADVSGRIVSESSIRFNNEIQVPVSQLQAGLYLILVRNEQGVLSVARFEKK